MISSSSKIYWGLGLTLTIWSLSACSAGPKAVAGESWAIVKLLSQGERIESVTETVEVRNCCGVVERKTVSCAAGTSNQLNVNIGASIGYQEGIKVSVDPGIGAALGFNQDSSESLELDPAPESMTYLYKVTKTYTTIAGEALIRSSSGAEQSTSYRFQAKCSLRIEPDIEKLNCQEICGVQPVAPIVPPVVNHSPNMVDLQYQGKLAFVVRYDTGTIFSELFMLDLTKPGNQPVSILKSKGQISAPIFSPDGRRIAYYAYLAKKTLFLMDAFYGASPESLAECGGASWSQDGLELLCHAVDGPGFIFIDVSNGSIVDTLPVEAKVASWSPTRNEVVLGVDGFEIWRIVLDTGERTLLVGGPNTNYMPAYSPDGYWIAYQSNYEIWIMNSDGKNQRQITYTPGNAWSRSPSWSPDGKWIAFVSSHAGSSGADNGEVFIVSIDSPEVYQITNTGGRVYDYRVSWGK